EQALDTPGEIEDVAGPDWRGILGFEKLGAAVAVIADHVVAARHGFGGGQAETLLIGEGEEYAAEPQFRCDLFVAEAVERHHLPVPQGASGVEDCEDLPGIVASTAWHIR